MKTETIRQAVSHRKLPRRTQSSLSAHRFSYVLNVVLDRPRIAERSDAVLGPRRIACQADGSASRLPSGCRRVLAADAGACQRDEHFGADHPSPSAFDPLRRVAALYHGRPDMKSCGESWILWKLGCPKNCRRLDSTSKCTTEGFVDDLIGCSVAEALARPEIVHNPQPISKIPA